MLFLATAVFAQAQKAYYGKGDKKFQVAANIQDGGTGIHASADFGLGENISYGFSATYLLAADGEPTISYTSQGFPYRDTKDAEFEDKIDAKFRFNANLGNVIGLPESMDVYPGLNLGLRNFGTHLGFRYFFTDVFGVFSEAGIPITKYGGSAYGVEKYNNQFVFNIGASFNF